MGYNSFPATMGDASLPTNRPSTTCCQCGGHDPNEETKYDWMVHSEPNALANATIPLWMVPGGCVAYITGQPCHYCAMLMVTFGVRKFVLANRKGWQKENEKTKRQFEKLVVERNIEVEYVTPDLTWILDGLEEPQKLGFIRTMVLERCFL
jgi:deoxycytidylate deaminase